MPATVSLTSADIGALHEIRARIELNCPKLYSSEQLLRLVYPRLNVFKLHYGFKQLFHTNPYAYYQELRFIQARNYLLIGDKVTAVAYRLNYHSPTTFIKAFKKRFGMTPNQFKQQHEKTSRG